MKQKQLLKTIIFLIVVSLLPIKAKAYTQTIEVEVGETFSISTTYHSNTTSIFWSYDYGYVEPVGSIGSTTSRVTFKATKPTGNSGIFIQAETTVSYGQNRYVDDWLIVISGEGDGGEGGDGGEPDWLDGWASDKTIEGHTMWFTLSKIYGEYVAQVCKDYQGNPTVSISATDNGKVTIPEYTRGYPVKGIKANSFMNLEYLTELVIPKTVNRIENYIVYNCPKLKKITCLNETPPTFYGSIAFDEAYNKTLYVPSEAAKQKYMIAEGWKNFKEYKVIGEEEQGGIAINETNFPDANFRNNLLGTSYGFDGVITEKEISDIKEIAANNEHIRSLRGIEFFTNLEILSCSENEIEELDVSKNPLLTKLGINKNKLKSLNLSNNAVLKSLSCSENEIEELDVSKNPLLTELYIDKNKLKSLDLSNNTVLNWLLCSNNEIKELDVSKNTLLIYISIGNNKVKSLDVSKNTALEYLYCYTNELTQLDVSNNTVLSFLSCYENNIKEEAMDKLVSSLPQNNTDKMYSFRVIGDENEGNVITGKQVLTAMAKKWLPQYKEDSQWHEIDGISVVQADKRSASVYSLSGQRLTSPRKGVNIIGGRKIVIK